MVPETERAARSLRNREKTSSKMSKTVAIRLSPSTNLLSRFLAAVDRWLMTYAEIQIRNGDVPRVGL
jgi:hypothetical protein